MKPIKLLLIGLAIFSCWVRPALADYTIIFKDGRTITVEDYKEEGGMIVLSRYGGQISIAREVVRSIIPAVKGMEAKLSLPPAGEVPGLTAEIDPGKEEAQAPKEPAPKEKVLTPEEIHARNRDKEAKEYQSIYKEIQDQIRFKTKRYWEITRGTSNPNPMLLKLSVLNARIDDLQSRLKDAQYYPGISRGTGVVNLEVGSPFGGGRMTIGLRHGGKIIPGRVTRRPFDIARPGRTDFAKRVLHPKRGLETPFTDYSYGEKVLSDLRNQLNLLHDERKRLIQDMERKGQFTGSLSFE